MIASVWQDARYAARGLRSSPLFTAIAVFTLALGIGAASALFTVVDAVLLRPLPFPEANRIVSVSTVARGADRGSVPGKNFEAWRREARSLEAMAVYNSSSLTYVGAGDPVQLGGARVSAELFTILAVKPVLGRTFAADEMIAGAPDVMVLSQSFWRQSLGGDPAVLGRTLMLDGKPYTVIGVVDERGAIPRSANYWLPVHPEPAGSNFERYYSMLGRLKPGLTIAAAQADLAAISKTVDEARPASQRGAAIAVMTLHDRMFGSVAKPLALLFGAVTFLLLIACANVANLLLARGASRRREMAVRLALGASRLRLIRQVLLESVMLSGMGAALGMLIPVWAVGVFVRMSPDVVSRVGDIHVNGHVLAFASGVAVLTALLFGMLPAWSSSADDAMSPLKDGTRAAGSVRQQRTRRVLVAAELATALVLLTGAGLLTRSFVNVLAVDIGFDPQHLTSASIYLPRARYTTDVARQNFFTALDERVRAIPGVHSAALTDAMPGGGFSMTTSLSALAGSIDSAQVAIATVAREYPRTVGLQLVAGRMFDATDTPGAPLAAILSAAAARALFPGGNAVGQQLSAASVSDEKRPSVVVGVVKDVPQLGVDVAPMPQVYFVHEQVGGVGPSIVVRATIDPAQLEAMIRHVVTTIDPLQPVASFEQIDRVLAKSIAPRRLNFLLINIFAGLALLLAAVGLYGVMAFQVAQRTRELGIRMALGATGGAVRRMVLRQGMSIVIVGCVAGIVLSAVASRILAGFLYGVTARDTGTFLAAPAILCAVAALACYVPARRATTVDPVVALRND